MTISRVGRSPLGAVYRSQLGVLGAKKTFPYMFMMFGQNNVAYQTEEALPLGLPLWNSDVAAYADAVSEWGIPQYGVAVIDVEGGSPPTFPSDNYYNFKPQGVPDGVDSFDVANPPTGASIIEIYDEVRNSKPANVTIILAVNRSLIAAGLNEFEDHLDSEGVSWFETPGFDQWMGILTGLVNALGPS